VAFATPPGTRCQADSTVAATRRLTNQDCVTSDYDLLLMGTGFETKRIFITGGAGFLGGAVQAALRARGVTDIVSPTSAEVDFLDPTAAHAAIEASQPDILIHLAARVGGIGANMNAPASLYLENLVLGTNVIEAARHASVDKTLVVGTIAPTRNTPRFHSRNPRSGPVTPRRPTHRTALPNSPNSFTCKRIERNTARTVST